MINIKDWSIKVSSDLYVAGTSDDGHDYLAESYCVILTSTRGIQLVHHRNFPGCETEEHEGITHFGDVREEAEGAARRLVKRIIKAGEINIDNWITIEPEYGSEAYVAQCSQMTPQQLAEF